MKRKPAEYDVLMQQIDFLKQMMCPEKYQYTHEYLDLALTAARREAPCIARSIENDHEIAIHGVVDSSTVH